MGFVWSDTITASVTKIKASQATELHDNIDTDRVSVGLAKYSWATTPVASVTHIKAENFDEMMTALDQAYDANTCSTHNTTHESGYNSKAYLNDNSTHYGVYKNNVDQTYKSNHNVTHESTYEATVV